MYTIFNIYLSVTVQQKNILAPLLDKALFRICSFIHVIFYTQLIYFIYALFWSTYIADDKPIK